MDCNTQNIRHKKTLFEWKQGVAFSSGERGLWTITTKLLYIKYFTYQFLFGNPLRNQAAKRRAWLSSLSFLRFHKDNEPFIKSKNSLQIIILMKKALSSFYCSPGFIYCFKAFTYSSKAFIPFFVIEHLVKGYFPLNDFSILM